MEDLDKPILYIVIPCYNEEAVLPVTSGMFRQKVLDLAGAGKISAESRVLFVNDGSKDGTWDIIRGLADSAPEYEGICLSRNRGHQNALQMCIRDRHGSAAGVHRTAPLDKPPPHCYDEKHTLCALLKYKIKAKRGNEMARVYNFSAGPSMLPLPVLELSLIHI